VGNNYPSGCAYQILIIVASARAELGIDITIESRVCALNWSCHAVQSTLANGFDQPKSRLRHRALRPESEVNILTSTRKQAEKSVPLTRTDSKHYFREVCKFEVSPGWIHLLILRHSAEFAEKKKSPQEEPRLQVPRVFPNETTRSMHEKG
jgi:hypothetical protein